jgi:cytochrome c oxidase assembly protein subunit 15
MVGGVFFEHGHRMVAGTVGVLTLILAVWTQVRERRRPVRILAWAAALAVLAQGILGGLTVLFLLPTSVSVAHACLAQTFFCLVIACASVTSPSWLSTARPKLVPGLRGSAITVVSLAFLQLLLGAIMRHLDARSWADSVPLPISDFPLSLGRVVPPLDSFPVTIHFAHRVCAVALLAACAFLALKCIHLERHFKRPALCLLGLVCLQIGLGAATVLSRRAVLPTTAHLLVGALILGTSFLLTLRAFHTLSSPESTEIVPSLDSVPVRP